MLKNVLYYFLERRHFWRYVGFDQLSELYTSMLLRSMGLNLVGIFIPIYLYMNGTTLPNVMLFMVGVYGMRIISDLTCGFVVACYGTKLTMLASNVLQLASLGMLLTLNDYYWPLWLIATVWAISLSLFYIAYHVNFSKIINMKHGGKEIGLMTMFERGGAILGPLIGGLVATVYGADKTIIAAIILFVLASIPLLVGADPIKPNQRITLRGLDLRRFWRDYVTHFGLGYDTAISTGLWPLYLGVVIFSASAYAGVGLVTSIGIVAAILSARAIGSLVDRQHGRPLLRWSIATKSVINLVRPLIYSSTGSALLNVMQEATSTGIRLPFTKGMYDRSDRLPGYRIAYIISMEIIGDLGKVMTWLVPWILTFYIDPVSAIATGFVIGGFVTLLGNIERFPALNKRRFM